MTRTHTCPTCEDEFDTDHGIKVLDLLPRLKTRGADHRIWAVDELDEANRLSNLVTLCRGCHSRWEGIPLFPIPGGEASA